MPTSWYWTLVDRMTPALVMKSVNDRKIDIEPRVTMNGATLHRVMTRPFRAPAVAPAKIAAAKAATMAMPPPPK